MYQDRWRYTHTRTHNHTHTKHTQFYSLEPCCFMRSNNSLSLGIRSLRHRVERIILKNSTLIAEFWGILFSIWGILTIKKGKESLVPNKLYIKVRSLMVKFELLWIYISQTDLYNIYTICIYIYIIYIYIIYHIYISFTWWLETWNLK